MIVDAKPKKIFEKPDAGLFDGVLGDIIYLEDQPSAFGPKNLAIFVWVLSAKDKEGNQFRVSERFNRSLDERSRLYARVRDIRGGTPPPVPFELETLLGSQNQILVTRANGVDKKTGKPEVYANVAGVLPAKPGVAVTLPQGFVRRKDKPAKGAQPAQAAASAPAQAAPAAAVSQVQDDSAEAEF